MRTCSICGRGYPTKGEDILICGCRICHKGDWQKNQRELLKIEQNSPKFESVVKYLYGRPLKEIVP